MKKTLLLSFAVCLLSGCTNSTKTTQIVPDKKIFINSCGSTDFLAQKNSNNIDFETDSALVCFGENLLNNCTESQITLQTGEAGNIVFSIEGGDLSTCEVKAQYGSSEQITALPQKAFADKNLICPINLNEIKEKSPIADLSKTPGQLAFSIYFLMGLESQQKERTCRGTYYDQ